MTEPRKLQISLKINGRALSDYTLTAVHENLNSGVWEVYDDAGGSSCGQVESPYGSPFETLAARALRLIVRPSAMSDLDNILADLAKHPDSTAREIAARLGLKDDRRVFRLLDRAAYDGKCQRWRPGSSGSQWRWEIPSGLLKR